MTPQQMNKPVSNESVADDSLEQRVQKAVTAYEKACKARRYQERLQADALESLAESLRLLQGARF